MRTMTFAVLSAMAADLEAVGWPPHPTTNRPPRVSIGQDETNQDESIVVRLRTDNDDATAAWASMGRGGRDERFIADVWILSSVPGATYSVMWDRLAELTEAVLDVFIDEDGQFVKPSGTELDEDMVPPYGVWDGAANAELQNQWGTDEGWSGECRVAVRIAARI